MCGITGFVDPRQMTSPEDLRARVTGMAACLAHRGPDHGDAWVDPASGVALGHRRLAIVDLTVEGQQPMHSADGRYVMVYNGEVYNFGALRPALEALGHHFRGTSDTEVMLAAIQQWGLPAALEQFNGMFAFALWDRQTRSLSLVRDRLGIKPLYYGWSGGVFFFASELKALRAHPAFQAEVDADALALYFEHGYMPAPHAIYRGIRQLAPGRYLTLAAPFAPESLRLDTYWSAREVAQRGIDAPFDGSESEALQQLDDLLRDSVRQRMIADVPLGAFLSGGVDSSLVVALMQVQSSRPVRTFTIGFTQAAYNEADHAQAVARHLGTEHTELYVTPEEALAVIPRLPEIYDEPFADSSQIPTFLVSQMTRRHVTVSLSGDGGDELFAGYRTYRHGLHMWNRARRLPGSVRPLAGGLQWLSIQRWDDLLRLTGGRPAGLSGKRIHIAAELFRQGHTRERLYRYLVSQWMNSTRVVCGAHEVPTAWDDPARWVRTPHFVQWMQALDLTTYLPDDILVKLDRASMSVSLEARVPLLDYRVVEFAWTLPPALNLRHAEGKWPLRQVLYRYVPPDLIERPKKGFSVPLADWLRGPLRDWAEALLNERRLAEQGYLNAPLIRRTWQDFLTGHYERERNLWTALMFQGWLETVPHPER